MFKLVKLDSLSLYWNCGSECYTSRDKQAAQKVLLETIAGQDKKVDFLYREYSHTSHFCLANVTYYVLQREVVCYVEEKCTFTFNFYWWPRAGLVRRSSAASFRSVAVDHYYYYYYYAVDDAR